MTVPEFEPTNWEQVHEFAETVIKPENGSPEVLAAFSQVDRRQFVPPELGISDEDIYSDKVIKLNENSTISQPTYMAKMIDLLDLDQGHKVLEVGTATGFQSALLSKIASEVHTIEIDPDLAEKALANHKRLTINNVHVHVGDGAKGLPIEADFDAVIFTAHIKEMPPAILGQVAVEGCIVAPVGQDSENAILSRYKVIDKGKKFSIDVHGSCAFVPLFSEEKGGWTARDWKSFKNQKEAKVRARVRPSWERNLTQLWEGEGKAPDKVLETAREEAKSILGVDEVTNDQVIDLIAMSLILIQRTEEE